MGPKILIVDDFELMRLMLKRALKPLGLENFVEAGNVEDACKMLEECHSAKTPVQLIFLDWNLPGGTGYDLLVQWKQDPRFKSIPVIMVTSETGMAYMTKAKEAGATDFICKPISQNLLKEKIEKFVHLKKAI